jgi:hypothetical protein
MSMASPPAVSFSASVDGELIIVKEDGAFAIYLYLKDRKIKEDGDKRILHSKSKAYAKVIGSFNFFE